MLLRTSCGSVATALRRKIKKSLGGWVLIDGWVVVVACWLLFGCLVVCWLLLVGWWLVLLVVVGWVFFPGSLI